MGILTCADEGQQFFGRHIQAPGGNCQEDYTRILVSQQAAESEACPVSFLKLVSCDRHTREIGVIGDGAVGGQPGLR